MFTVKATNDEGGVTLARNVKSIEKAREIGVKAYRNGDIDEADIVQIWNDEDEHTAAEEFGSDEIWLHSLCGGQANRSTRSA